jgi:UTP--glucose-1-phosphate uridylyltransferase
MDAGICQVCVVVGPGQEELVVGYLKGPGEAYLKRLENRPELMQEAQSMRAALDMVTFAVQEQPEGYGHAVFQSRSFAGDEPVLLCLGDHLFRGDDESCHRQLLRAYGVCGGRSVSAVNRIGPSELHGYGTIAGRRRQERPDIIDVMLIIEKPTVEVARERLRVDGLESDQYLGWFGMHVLSPSLYDVLEQMIVEDIRVKGEIQLTHAQELLRQREGYCALEIADGRRFDFGLPEEYVKSMMEFAEA